MTSLRNVSLTQTLQQLSVAEAAKGKEMAYGEGCRVIRLVRDEDWAYTLNNLGKNPTGFQNLSGSLNAPIF